VLDYMNTLFLGTVLFLVLYMLNAILTVRARPSPFETS